ncbi:unnamed protein product [Alopecurus aequalis]
MSKLLAIAILLLPLINHGNDLARAWDDQDFFKYCPPSQCSQHGPVIRYPFCLESSNTSTSSCGCGDQSIRRLACSGQDTILVHPVLGPYNVNAIDYRHSSMKLIPPVDPCMVLQKKLVISKSSSSPQVYDPNDQDLVHFVLYPSLLCSSREFTPGADDTIVGPVSCLSNATHFFYFVDIYTEISLLPLDCKLVPISDGRQISMFWFDDLTSKSTYTQSFKKSAESILGFAESTVYWEVIWEDQGNCGHCEPSGGRCAFSTQRKHPFCMPDPHGSRRKVIAATSSVAAFLVLLLTVATVLYLSLRTRYNEEIHLKVEMFLKTYGSSKPTRYTFSENVLVPHKLLDIALGIARGMEYLHQGCNQQILHFDIKPHNILLDYNFNPKISDFGLAKLCAKDQSIVTLTAARGTMGYIAPELYSRNFGGVSYKSDVYSFGMLVLEMVSGRRNSDPSTESLNAVYLPEWIYEKVINDQELVLTLETTQEDKEKVLKLAIVALWCIQWNPRNRPSMTKVVNMLTGRLQNLQMPPKPFVSFENEPMP